MFSYLYFALMLTMRFNFAPATLLLPIVTNAITSTHTHHYLPFILPLPLHMRELTPPRKAHYVIGEKQKNVIHFSPLTLKALCCVVTVFGEKEHTPSPSWFKPVTFCQRGGSGSDELPKPPTMGISQIHFSSLKVRENIFLVALCSKYRVMKMCGINILYFEWLEIVNYNSVYWYSYLYIDTSSNFYH